MNTFPVPVLANAADNITGEAQESTAKRYALEDASQCGFLQRTPAAGDSFGARGVTVALEVRDTARWSRHPKLGEGSIPSAPSVSQYTEDDRSIRVHARAMVIQTLLAFKGRSLAERKRLDALTDQELSAEYDRMMD